MRKCNPSYAQVFNFGYTVPHENGGSTYMGIDLYSMLILSKYVEFY